MESLGFCKILFGVNGGKFTATGLPIIGESEDDAERARGKCWRAFDCGSCIHMSTWLAQLEAQGWHFAWECDRCLRETEKLDKEAGTTRFVQGFYQAGRKYDRSPDDPDYDSDRPGLEGCTRCGWESSFLQLVLRR